MTCCIFKKKHPTESLHIFLIGGVSTRKIVTLVYYKKHVTTFYKKYDTC